VPWKLTKTRTRARLGRQPSFTLHPFKCPGMIRYSNAGAYEEKPELASDKSPNQRQIPCRSPQTWPPPSPNHFPSTAVKPQVLKPIQSGYALARLLAKFPSLNGTFAAPKSVFVNAVRAAAVRLSQAISGCCPPRELVKPSLLKQRENVSQPHPTPSPLLSSQKDKTH
jgi:hypothetical protein